MSTDTDEGSGLAIVMISVVCSAMIVLYGAVILSGKKEGKRQQYLAQAKTIVDHNKNQITEMGELRALGIKLNVVSDNENLQRSELERRVSNAPYNNLKQFVEEYGAKND